jgi:ribosomal-protein-alanine N-acetyltransferase
MEPGFDWGERLPALGAGRVGLRWLEPADVPALFEVFSDPEVMRYWSSTPLVDEEAAAGLLRHIHDRFAARALFQWGISRQADNRVIGTCTLFHLDAENRRAEIGFALGQAHWGQGLASEALGLLIGFAFGTLGLHRLEADVDPRNAASLRILERQGFRREGLLRERFHVGGEVQDSAFLGLLRREWPGRAAPGGRDPGTQPAADPKP